MVHPFVYVVYTVVSPGCIFRECLVVLFLIVVVKLFYFPIVVCKESFSVCLSTIICIFFLQSGKCHLVF